MDRPLRRCYDWRNCDDNHVIRQGGMRFCANGSDPAQPKVLKDPLPPFGPAQAMKNLAESADRAGENLSAMNRVMQQQDSMVANVLQLSITDRGLTWALHNAVSKSVLDIDESDAFLRNKACRYWAIGERLCGDIQHLHDTYGQWITDYMYYVNSRGEQSRCGFTIRFVSREVMRVTITRLSPGDWWRIEDMYVESSNSRMQLGHSPITVHDIKHNITFDPRSLNVTIYDKPKDDESLTQRIHRALRNGISQDVDRRLIEGRPPEVSSGRYARGGVTHWIRPNGSVRFGKDKGSE